MRSRVACSPVVFSLAAFAPSACSSPASSGPTDAAAYLPEGGDAPTPLDAGSDAASTADVFAPAQPFGPNESLQTITSARKDSQGNDVTLAFDLVTPAATPARVVILLVGGSGVLRLSSAGFGQGADNFVARTRAMYAAAGFAAAIPDAPSDHDGGLDNFRATAGHATDIGTMVQWLRNKWGAPVWLVGTSRGTISAANAAASLSGMSAPDGIVLTSSVTVIPKDATDAESIYTTNIQNILVNVLMVHNQLDGCGASHFADAQTLAGKLAKATFDAVSGGAETGQDPCGALTYHGFYGPSASEPAQGGMDDLVVPKIVAFVSGH